MLQPEQVKSFINHPERTVRNFAVQYFYDNDDFDDYDDDDYEDDDYQVDDDRYWRHEDDRGDWQDDEDAEDWVEQRSAIKRLSGINSAPAGTGRSIRSAV